MIEWKQIKISDLGKVVTGNTPPRKNPEYYGDHTIFIKPTDISEDEKYTYQPEECYSDLGLRKYKSSLIPTGSTCVVTIGSIGKKITKAHCDCFINQAMNAVIPNDNFDQEFVFYVLKYNLSQLKMLDSGTASGRENVSKSSFANIKINVPKSKDVQSRIGKILASYDDLIENNFKRIKILEEIAQRTYEEWFVKFRVNGEQLQMDEATWLPVGWERKSMSSIGDFINGFAFKPSDFLPTGKPIIKIKEMKNGIGNDTPLNDGSRVPSKYLVKRGDLLFSWSGSLEVVIWRGVEGWLNQHLFKVIPKKDIPMVFLHQSLLFVLKEFNNLTTGSTMKHIKRKELDFVTVPVPNTRYISDFDKIISPIQQQILNLSNQIQLFKQSRDILLPRLMSGNINVES